VVVQDVDSVFDIDTMKAIRDRICALADTTYQLDEEKDVSIRLITDHIRSATFLISDGVMPSNEGRGYVLRRLIRRAARHGRKLGIEGEFLAELSKTVISESKDGYPELEEKREFILKVLNKEEEQFNKTIDKGLSILNDMQQQMKESGTKQLTGDDAFKLYDTYGFPLDLTTEILQEQGYTVDEAGFAEAMEQQKKKAHDARKETNYMGAEETVYQQIDPAITTEFVGYDRLVHESVVTVLATETELVDALTDGQTGTIIVKETPFYATMGGQQADVGVITAGDASFEVKDTVKLQGGKVGHIGVVTSGMIKTGDTVTLKVCPVNRQDTGKNHSATHLLQKALRLVLGNHVEQAGSYVDADRLRFDFTHFSAMTPEELAKVEALVNEQIAAGLTVETNVMSLEEAKKTGAMALFGEKYGENVRVVQMGDFSTELCGGTHVANTRDISSFKILSESGVASGVRRIEALTSTGLMKHYAAVEEELKAAAVAAKTEPSNLVKKIVSLQEECKALQSENEKLKSKLANQAAGDVDSQIQEIQGVKLLAMSVPEVDMNGLRGLGDQMKEKLGEGVVVLASAQGSKVSLLAMATKEAMDKGAHAGNLIKAIASQVGGGGGGRPNMAQAGGKNPEGIPAAIEQAAKVLEEQLS
jgi:alanyl-tRNA synthetase